MTKSQLTRLLVVLALGVLGLNYVAAAATAQAPPDGVVIADCYDSGRGEGTLVDTTATDLVVFVFTDQGVRGPSRFILVLPGETYEIRTADGEVVYTSTGSMEPCDGDTTTTANETTTTAEVTTTTGDVTTTTGDVTTTTEPEASTTTTPGFPGTEDCPDGQNQIGEDADGNAVCEAAEQGG